MIYYDAFTGRYFKESADLVTKLFDEFYVDEVKLLKDTREWEFTKTAKIVSIIIIFGCSIIFMQIKVF